MGNLHFQIHVCAIDPAPQADVTGLCWVRYTGPLSSTLEAPQDDHVLKTYAQLLNEG